VRRILRRNIRRFVLYIRLKGMEEAIAIGKTSSIKQLLQLLRKYEDEYGDEIIEKFFVMED